MNLLAPRLLEELWNTMSDALKKLAFNQDKKTTMTSEALMLQGIKEMTVTTFHPAIHSLASRNRKSP